MTASSAGTPLILSILSLVVSLVVGVGAVLMARANLQRQIQVAAREAWMREFRERVAQFLTAIMNDHNARTTGGEEVAGAGTLAFHVTSLLIAEKGPLYAEFLRVLRGLLVASNDLDLAELSKRSGEVSIAAATILQMERAVIDAIIADTLTAVWCARAAARWSRLMAWCRGRPRFPT
jgi:hypothetical protein